MNNMDSAAFINNHLMKESNRVTSSGDKSTKKSNDELEVDKLMRNVVTRLKTPGNRVSNILLVGRPSAGKSSLINLLRATLAGFYEQVAEPGSASHGTTNSMTGHLRYFKNMGLSDQEMKSFLSFHGFGWDFQLPAVVDMPGLEGDGEGMEDILKYIVDGAVPGDADVLTALSGNGKLRRLDFTWAMMEARKIDLVVFVVNVQQDVPERLLEEVMKVICFSGGKRKRIPYFLLFTHVDCVDESASTVAERKRIAASILNIGSNQKLNSHELVCYSDNDPLSEDECSRYKTDLAKHAEGLKVLCKLLRPRGVIDDKCGVDVTDPLIDWWRRICRVIMKLSRTIWWNLSCLIVIVFAILCWWFLSSSRLDPQVEK